MRKPTKSHTNSINSFSLILETTLAPELNDIVLILKIKGLRLKNEELTQNNFYIMAAVKHSKTILNDKTAVGKYW